VKYLECSTDGCCEGYRCYPLRNWTAAGQGHLAALHALWQERGLDGSGRLHAHACFAVRGEKTELALTVNEDGRLEQIQYQRWGNPGNGDSRSDSFGGFAEREATFGGYTIPTCLRVGWQFGTERFESEGKFFRVTIDEALLR